jgi:hypothetical protein
MAFGIAAPSRVEHLLGDWLANWNVKHKRQILVGVTALCWSIWLCRNDVEFNRVRTSWCRCSPRALLRLPRALHLPLAAAVRPPRAPQHPATCRWVPASTGVWIVPARATMGASSVRRLSSDLEDEDEA